MEGETFFENDPDYHSIIILSLPSNSLSAGLQSFIIPDTTAFELEHCKEAYRHYGIPCPPSREATVSWLRPNKSVVFLQTAEKGLPFKVFDKAEINGRIIITTPAYINLLEFFVGQPESEWCRVEKKIRLQLEAMRTSIQPIAWGVNLKFVGPGSCTFTKILNVQKDWKLTLQVYGRSVWKKDAQLQLTLKYNFTGTAGTPKGGPSENKIFIRIYPQVLMDMAILTDIQKLKRCQNIGPEFTPSQILLRGEQLILPPPRIDTPLLTYTPTPIKRSNSSKKGSSQKTSPTHKRTTSTPTGAAKSKKAALEETFKKCGLPLNSSSEEEDEEDTLDHYSIPVPVAATRSTSSSSSTTHNNSNKKK